MTSHEPDHESLHDPKLTPQQRRAAQRTASPSEEHTIRNGLIVLGAIVFIVVVAIPAAIVLIRLALTVHL